MADQARTAGQVVPVVQVKTEAGAETEDQVSMAALGATEVQEGRVVPVPMAVTAGMAGRAMALEMAEMVVTAGQEETAETVAMAEMVAMAETAAK